MIVWIAIGQTGHYGWIYMHYLIYSVFQWRGHDLISDLRSPNKKILDRYLCILLQPIASHHMQTFKTLAHKLLVLGRGKVCSTLLQLTLASDLT